MGNGFINKFNDYQCIYKNDTEEIIEVCHYTNGIDAVCNIANGCFWATDMPDFYKDGDTLEGKLIFTEILELAENIVSQEHLQYIKEFIGSEASIDAFINNHITNVVSLCLNNKSSYMWEEYAKNDGYCIHFDRKKLTESMYFITKGAEKKAGKYIKHAPIIYDNELQKEIINKELKDMLENMDECLILKENIEYILQHLMYVGNYYKKSNGEDTQYEKEQEYRVLTNTSSNVENLDECLPEHYLNTYNNKHYIEILFDKSAITKIECGSETTQDMLKKILQDVVIELREKI